MVFGSLGVLRINDPCKFYSLNPPRGLVLFNRGLINSWCNIVYYDNVGNLNDPSETEHWSIWRLKRCCGIPFRVVL